MFNFFMQIPKSHLLLLIFLLLISLSNFPGANSQPSNPTTSNNTNGNYNQYAYGNFNPSIAIIIVVLVAALFFMGFFSIYIRHCADDNSGGSVRNLLSMHTRRANAASRGIEESVLETFPTFSYAEVKDHKFGKGALECAVCLNEFEDTETLRLIPRCDHVFHAECIDAWLQGHVTCPVCRADLSPKTGEEEQSDHLPESMIPEIPESNDNQTVRNDDVTVQIDTQERSAAANEVKPGVNRNLSFGNVNRTTRNESVKGAGRRNIVGGFRSHSTGHSLSLVQPGENLDRFTLRLPHEIRKEMMNRALLNRTKSFAPRNGSTRGYGDGSSRGGQSFRRIEQSDRNARSDRWGFSKAVPFFSRVSSLRSPKVVAENSEGSTSRSIKNTVRMPSFKCLEPRSADETGLIQANSDRPPV